MSLSHRCLVLALGGCSGGDVETVNTVNTRTVGQELIDLQKALKSGSITKQEYADLKEKILDRD